MPKIAAVVPAFNEEKTLGNTLNSLLHIFSHKDIYVISDGSTDGTAAKAREYTENVLDEFQNRGKMKSLNYLIQSFSLAERYDYILFVDADTIVAFDFLEQVTPLLTDDTACIVGQIISRSHNFLTFYRKIEYFIGQEIYKKSQSSLGIITVAPGCSSIFNTRCLKEIDFSNPTLAEDLDMTIQIYRKKLGKIKYCSQARVYTQDPATFRDFYNQIKRWHCGWFQCLKRYRVPFGWTRFDLEALYLTSEGVIYGCLTLGLPWLIFKYPQLTLMGILADFSIFFLFTLYISYRNKIYRYLPLVPLYYVLKMLQSIIYIRCLCFSRNHLWRKVRRY